MNVRKTLLTLICFFLAAAAHAQSVPRGARGITATVTSVQGTTITLFDGRVTVDASRAIVRSDLGPATLADIQPDDRISVQLVGWQTDGALVAAMIHILRFPDAALSGEAEAVDAASGVLTVLGLQVRVTSATVLRGLGGEAITLADVRPHQQVRVELDGSQPGLVAKTIIVMSPVPDISNTFIGIVEKIEADVWTVRASDATVVLVTTPETQIIGTPRAGDRVMVTYKRDASGRNIALTISLAPQAPPRPVRPMSGKVTEITATSMTITMRPTGDFATFVINEQTLFFGGRPAVGDDVLVYARNSDGVNTAIRVVRIDNSTQNRIFFDGVLHVVEGNVWTIDTHKVVVNERTRLIGNPQPGDRVHVIATQMLPDLTLYALEISKIGTPWR